MRQFLTIAVCAASLAAAMPVSVEAAPGVISRACKASDRPAANARLCGCVQRVANQTLTKTERRTVAKWFSDPHRAQEIRMSDRGSDERLWQRYKNFGETAKAVCS